MERAPERPANPGRPAPLAGGEAMTTAAELTTMSVEAPRIELPKGGGAIRSIGEKFSANPVTGAATLSVPIFASPGRANFGPQLALSYDSGAGNGPFGLGWQLALSAITRKTSQGLPRYLNGRDADGFLIDDAEDLVPVLEQWEDTWRPVLMTHVLYGATYQVQLFRPRIEGLFARIECWSNVHDAADVFWRSMSRDNITSWYGKSVHSRIQDPEDPARIFSWLLCDIHDDKGNRMSYRYRAEDAAGIDPDATHERNRSDLSRSAGRYLDRIQYGNQVPYFPELGAAIEHRVAPDWLFELVFDYGDYDVDNPTPTATANWPVRADPFSTYRPGFEVRTYRLCRRVLMFHHFADDAAVGLNCLVGSTDFSYESADDLEMPAQAGYTTLAAVTQCSYQRSEGGYRARQLPPLSFRYSAPVVDATLRTIAPDQLARLPVGTQGPGYMWIDLDGEGLPGVLTEQAGAWHYTPNYGDGRFGPTGVAREVPARAIHAPATANLRDLDGDGALELVSLQAVPAGFHERDMEQRWRAFIPFARLPNIDWDSANLRFLDLSGAGHADALLTEDQVFIWYPSLAQDGYGPDQRVPWMDDEERGPRLVFADGTDTIFLADMCGDGLTDLVRIRNGEVCYWPNLGYGRFGAKVSLDNPPYFDHPDLYDPHRVRLADIDGSGPTDLIYLGRAGAALYFNRSGNSLSDALHVDLPVATANLAAVQVSDLLGTGTACLVWNSDLPADVSGPLRYIDLMRGPDAGNEERRRHDKPHLLIEVNNNLGGTTHIEYTPSTRFYIDDKLGGTPWVTRLPFPVQCVSRVTVSDRWRGTAFSSTYSYHHGYFDGIEREFHGFGRVEQVDVEDYGIFTAANSTSPWITDEQRLFQPAVKTVSWFHTGVAGDRKRVLGAFADEYFPAGYAMAGGFREHALPEPPIEAQFDHALDRTLDADTWREAQRACKGMLLRQETYELAIDEPAVPDARLLRLYSSSSHNCHIRCLQPRAGNRHAVFHVAANETLVYHYEQDLPPRGGSVQADPRIVHNINLRIDELGNPLQALAINYPRSGEFSDDALDNETLQAIRAAQDAGHILYVETRYTDDLALPAESGMPTSPLLHRRLRLPWEVRTVELSGLTWSPGRFFGHDDFRRLDLSEHYRPVLQGAEAVIPVAQLPYERLPDGGTLQRREIELLRTLYFDDRDGIRPVRALPLGHHGPRGLKFEDYRLVLTADLLAGVFRGPFIEGHEAADLLAAEAHPGASVRSLLDQPEISGYLRGADLVDRFAPRVHADELAGQYWQHSGIAGFAEDARGHYYLPELYTDPFGNPTTLEYDRRDLYILRSTDARDNSTTVIRFDHRLLAPAEFEDPNGNRIEACFDVLGRVVALALKGKQLGGTWEADDLTGFADSSVADPAPADVQAFCTSTTFQEGQARDWLRRASTRYIYHFGEAPDAGGNTVWATRPAMACAITREVHAGHAGLETSPSPLHLALECSDGSGAVLMTKIEAEPALRSPPDSGPSTPRWLVNGLTVFNNKGKPVKQYEPFFSADFGCQIPTAVGVTALMFYDAPGRLIRTEMPDGTFSKVVFSPWHQLDYDANDTVLESNWYSHRNEHVPDEPLPRNLSGQITAAPAARAAWLAARHADTPALTAFDSLGRAVAAVTHNRIEDDAGALRFDGRRWRNEKSTTVTRRDTEGKPLWVRDARGNLVTQHIRPPSANNDHSDTIPTPAVLAFDFTGNALYQHGMDGGDRWMLPDAAGQPLFAWDFNEQQHGDGGPMLARRLYRDEYDALRRPLRRWLRINEGTAHLIERFDYGDPGPGADSAVRDAARANNLCGHLHLHLGPDGQVTNGRFDFKGNVLEVRRRFTSSYAAPVVDWSGEAPAAALQAETYIQLTEYDALDRITRRYNWHRGIGSRVAVYLPGYNRRGLLATQAIVVGATKTENGFVPGAARTDALEAVTYNARGQTARIEYGNGSISEFDYDADTFRLTALTTTGARGAVLQDLHYTYDPIGNIAAVHDRAQQTVYFANAVVEPHAHYEYDALYRLMRAEGREHAAQNNIQRDNAQFVPELQIPFPNSPGALQSYVEDYRYDPAGNILSVSHQGGAHLRWKRCYQYADDSNRLLASGRPGDLRNVGDPCPPHYVRTPTLSQRYAHDTHGNMLNLANVAPAQFIRWDYRDMVHALDLVGGGWAYYNYDANKQRTRKRLERTGGVAEDRLYLDDMEVYQRWHGQRLVEEIETHHVMLGGQRVLLVEDVITTDNPLLRVATLNRYQHGNQIGSVSMELNQEGEPISYEEYHPYGSTAYQANNREVQASAKRYRYTGRERDEESGLSYHHARFYSPFLCRWTAADVLPATLNRYAYADANPVSHGDTSGLQPQIIRVSTRPPEVAERGASVWAHGTVTVRYAGRHQRQTRIAYDLDEFMDFERVFVWDPEATATYDEAVIALALDDVSRALGESSLESAFAPLMMETEPSAAQAAGPGPEANLRFARSMLSAQRFSERMAMGAGAGVMSWGVFGFGVGASFFGGEVASAGADVAMDAAGVDDPGTRAAVSAGASIAGGAAFASSAAVAGAVVRMSPSQVFSQIPQLVGRSVRELRESGPALLGLGPLSRRAFEVHHLLPEYVGKMLGYTAQEMAEHPGLYISRWGHQGGGNLASLHRVISKFIKPGGNYTPAQIRTLLEQAYGQLGRPDLFQLIEHLL